MAVFLPGNLQWLTGVQGLLDVVRGFGVLEGLTAVQGLLDVVQGFEVVGGFTGVQGLLVDLDEQAVLSSERQSYRSRWCSWW